MDNLDRLLQCVGEYTIEPDETNPNIIAANHGIAAKLIEGRDDEQKAEIMVALQAVRAIANIERTYAWLGVDVTKELVFSEGASHLPMISTAADLEQLAALEVGIRFGIKHGYIFFKNGNIWISGDVEQYISFIRRNIENVVYLSLTGTGKEISTAFDRKIGYS